MPTLTWLTRETDLKLSQNAPYRLLEAVLDLLVKRLTIQLFFLLTALSFIFVVQSAHAEEVTFVKEYSYQASEADSKLTARAIALEQVKRLLLEELGTYLISETEVKNFQLTKDKITTLSAGVVMTQILEDKWNGETYYLKAKIKADPTEVAKSIDSLRKDKHKDKELEESKRRADDALAELGKLKKEIETLKSDKQKQSEYNMAATVLSAKDWFEKGYALVDAGNYQSAIGAYSKAIELDTKDTMAYNNRGVAYYYLGDLKRAISDYNKAIELDPKNVLAYSNRGAAYKGIGDNERAIADYDRSIELDPINAGAYNNRGNAYKDLNDLKRAMADYDMALKLDSEYATAYNNRGIAYSLLGDSQRAIADFSRAIELDPKYAKAYNNRGLAYSDLGDQKRAIANYDKAIELDSKYTNAYNNRGKAYGISGDDKRAIADLKSAARLGNKLTQDWLKSQGIEW